jgi:hypothetical protein
VDGQLDKVFPASRDGNLRRPRISFEKQTRADILENWPEVREKPHPSFLWKWLEQALSAGRLQRDGEGRPNEPFRYWLRSRAQYLFADLPSLDPLELAPKLTAKEEMELVKRIVEHGM